MISTNDFRTGLTIEWDGGVWTVVDFQHVKPGKGAAFVRAKLKNVITGAVIENTFRAGEKLPKAQIEYREMQFLYESGGQYFLMDQNTYDQISLSQDVLADAIQYLKENMIIGVQFYEGSPIGIELPNFVELEIVETDPGLRGDTASGGTKPAKLETGAVVQVPLFVQTGDKIRVDTRTNQYLERV
ncbi:MAG TPA: elongation factor P [Armatimonadota bacterium]|jgi:elongation factor P|nr:elongation factor P [Bacillota bacterium]HPP75949.1 elongation factor P [Armatimonadota bacterium]HOB42106.1 elongation factor P [Bacillota bacterium]HOL50751.1 elongation factor P [Bacillota bacterium]HOO31481.1 elongation factor P [Bacillota bacterium]